jgi:hypothetical protein
MGDLLVILLSFDKMALNCCSQLAGSVGSWIYGALIAELRQLPGRL